MKTTATRGDTRGSNRAERHHRGTAEALEGLELWRRPEGIAGELKLGDGGLPGQATAS